MLRYSFFGQRSISTACDQISPSKVLKLTYAFWPTVITVFTIYFSLPPFRYRCKICDQRFFNSSKLRQHEKSCAKVKNFTCNICDYTTLSRKALQEHNLKVHQTERNPDLKPSSSSLKIPFKIKLHKCTDCSFKTKWPNSFKRHMDSGHKIIYNCCDSRFSSKKLLYQHKLAFHAKK